jgi:hypothetical protein
MDRNIIRFTLAIAICAVAGCEERWIELPAPVKETPAANVPMKLRQPNWPDRNGSGSCVIASSCSVFQWSNRPDLAAKFRKSYAGGQTETSIKQKYRANNVQFIAPERDNEYGDPGYLQWVSDTRRACIIWYFDSHCVTFCGFSKYNGKEVAWLLDNNRVQQFIPIERNQFIREWRTKYGGFCGIPLMTPAPQIPWQAYEVQM